MNSIERGLISDLRGKKILDEEFVEQFPNLINPDYIKNLLQSAMENKSSDDIEDALFLGFRFEQINRGLADIFCELLKLHWHISHEDIVSCLQEFKMNDCVNALHEAAGLRLEYLAFNDGEALGTKCVWALSKVGTDDAREKIRLIAESDDRPAVRQTALKLCGES